MSKILDGVPYPIYRLQVYSGETGTYPNDVTHLHIRKQKEQKVQYQIYTDQPSQAVLMMNLIFDLKAATRTLVSKAIEGSNRHNGIIHNT